MTADSRQGAARWFKHLVGAGTTVLCLLVFLRQINISELLGALAHFHWACLILGGHFVGSRLYAAHPALVYDVKVYWGARDF